MARYVSTSSDGQIENIGSKAGQLRLLEKGGHRVPRTNFIRWDAQFDSTDDDSVIEILKQELSSVIDPGSSYAVRSSANVEDKKIASFAGQFDSFLDVRGIEGVLEAVKKVWDSTDSERIRSYLEKISMDHDDLKMGVILQEMVPAEISGVSFSRNPMTSLNEVIVEAVRGSGTALVQEGNTPRRWVRKWGGWISSPPEGDMPIAVIEKVAEETMEIEREFGTPVDLEWIYDGREIYWIQVREITSLDNINIYSNKISKEFLPGMIKPLIWSINIPLVNGAWVRLFTEVIGENDIEPVDLSKQFYYRAYFNMGVIGKIFEALGMPRDSLEILMGIEAVGEEKPKFKPTARTFLHLPRLVSFAIDKWKFSRKVVGFLPQMWSRYQAMANTDMSRLEDEDILRTTDELFSMTQDTAYFNIVVPLLMQLYNRLLGTQLGRLGIDLNEIDITRGLEGLRELEPNFYLQRIHDQYLKPEKGFSDLLQGKTFEEIGKLPGAEKFHEELQTFIKRFGHFSESGNDFSSVPWRESPDLVLDMAFNAGTRGGAKLQGIDTLEIPMIQRPVFQLLTNRAREYRLLREQISSLYTYGYGRFRYLFLELGSRMVQRGALDRVDDIFLLYYDEIRNSIRAEGGIPNLRELVVKRRGEMEEYRDISLPTIIFGDRPPPIHSEDLEEIRGVPTSRGYYTGPARIIRGTEDFHKLVNGDVIVIPYSDVGWTPLFARAGAVIAESGGILSHSSIVAREYRIPAVVSVDRALDLNDGQLVSVDGFTGTVTLHDESSTNPGIPR